MTLVTAVLALILSQLPPVQQLVRGRRLNVAVSDNVQFFHIAGNTNLQLWLDIENTGGRALRIRRVKAVLTQNGAPLQTLTATDYPLLATASSTSNAVQVPFVELMLKPGDRWSGYLRFWDMETWSKPTEAQWSSLALRMNRDREAKVAAKNRGVVSRSASNLELLALDETLVAEAMTIFRTLRKLQTGEYQLTIDFFEGLTETPLLTEFFSFTLFDNDIHQLYSDTADYKYGIGIAFPQIPPYFACCGVALHPVSGP